MKKIFGSISLITMAFCTITYLWMPIRLQATTNYSLNNSSYLQNIEITLNYPDQIRAGEEFIFSINLKNPVNLLAPGTISVKFTNGFKPIESEIEGLNYQIKDNTALFSWDMLTSGNLFFISFPVKTAENLNGVYPVRVNYQGLGREIKENKGLYVVGKVRTSEEFYQQVQDRFSPVSIKLRYKEEVLMNSDYEVAIEIAKGKNTGGAKINIRIPPASSIMIDDTFNYTYTASTGRLQINLKSMPPNPVFVINVKVQNNSVRKSVYPISASVVFDNRTTAKFSDYIYITDRLTTSIYTSAKQEVAETESDYAYLEETFSQLDRLLQEWTSSTIGSTSGNSIVEKPDQAAGITSSQTVEKLVESEKPAEAPKRDNEKSILPKSVFFTVQIAASEIPMTGMNNFIRSMQIKIPVVEDYDGVMYRYIIGEYPTIDEAKDLRIKLINKGFHDAFVVKYENGIRVMPTQ